MIKSYAVVKHAGRHWDFYFVEDPKQTGVDISYSAGYTFSGSNTGCKPSYTCRQEAQAACDKLNAINPVGDYAVCPVLDASSDERMR